MATLTVYTFSQIVSNIATAVQSSASALYNFTVGSTLRAIAEATSGVVLWLQAIILQLLTVTRASTSIGSDLDSFMADFGVTREAAVAATGQVTFSRYTTTLQALVPIGATVQTADGTQTFTVLVDTSNAAYNPTLAGYVIAPSTGSVTVPVQAQSAGSAGNVQANTITVITTPIPAVDTATNASAFTNGIDAESDANLRARFVLYLASLSKATKAAVEYAIKTVQQNLADTFTENQNYDGTTNDGFFYVVIDDGSGTPPSGVLTAVTAAIEAVRPIGSRFAVFAPSLETANVSALITSLSGYTHSLVVASVASALSSFINALPLGTSLPYTQIASVIYGVAGVANATSILLNSGTSDLAATKKQKIRAGTMTIS